MGENQNWQSELRFDYVVAAVAALALPVSIVISPRLGYSHPWVLVSAWGCYGLAAGLAVLRVRLALLSQRPGVEVSGQQRGQRWRDVGFRALTCVFLIGLVLNGIFLATNLYLDYVDQEQNAQASDDSCQLHT